MNPPPIDDPFPLYDFSSEFLPPPDFDESFNFDFEESFNFDDVSAASNSSFYGRYDDESCSLSVEDYVQLHHRRRRRRARRRKNRHFRKDSVLLSPWYVNFLRPGIVRDLTHELSSSDRFGEFRSLFRMSLSKVEELTDILINRGYIRTPRSLKFQEVFRERSELFVLSALYRLGNCNSFRQCRSSTFISISEIRKFFNTFIDAMVNMKEEYVYLPRNLTELRRLSVDYDNVGLPGCCGSMDVVHVKWCSCPTGDHNRAKGKSSYPTLAFQCLTNFNRRIIGIFGPQFGSRNDKEIVKEDPNVHLVRNGWFKDVKWNYYDTDGQIREDRGVYLICDNGYHRWPTSISPYERSDNTTIEGFFSTNLESVRKDVECTFGILKKRWNMLNAGLHYRDIKVCEKIFVTCCCLHNFLLDQREYCSNSRVGRGLPIGDDGIWLDGHTTSLGTVNDSALSIQFGRRRSLLANHLKAFRRLGRHYSSDD